MAPTDTPLPLEGGCFCGAIRYRITRAPAVVSNCHCDMCRRAHGAPMVTWVFCPADGVTWLQGEPRTFRSSAIATRGFCPDCGTPLTFRLDAKPAMLDVSAATLDTPEAVTPNRHVWTVDRLPWLRLADGLPEFERDGD